MGSNRNEKPNGHTVPSESERPVVGARVHYTTKIDMMKRCYERHMRPANYLGMVIEEIEKKGGWDEVEKLIQKADSYDELQKELEGYKEALGKEQGVRKEKEKKAKRLETEKKKEADKAKGEGSEKGKLQDQVKKLQGEIDELKDQLEAEKKKREEVEERLNKANEWRKKEYDNLAGKEPPKGGW